MKENFDAALKTVLVFEGGKVDDPQDPGGRTCQGVTQRVCDAWRKNNGRALPFDVYDLMPADRDAIYRLQYADKVKFDALPAGVDLVMLDGAVNSGPRQAVLWCQRALGFTGKDVDGSLGETTFAAIQAADPAVLINGICDRRMAFLKALQTFGRFGKGWTARVERTRRSGLNWVAGSVTTPAPQARPLLLDAAMQRATIADARKIPIGSPGAGTAGIGAAVTASTATLQAVKAQLDPLTSFLPHTAQAISYVDHAQVLLGSIGGLLAIAGGLWFTWNRDRAAKLRDALDIPVPK